MGHGFDCGPHLRGVLGAAFGRLAAQRIDRSRDIRVAGEIIRQAVEIRDHALDCPGFPALLVAYGAVELAEGLREGLSGKASTK